MNYRDTPLPLRSSDCSDSTIRVYGTPLEPGQEFEEDEPSESDRTNANWYAAIHEQPPPWLDEKFLRQSLRTEFTAEQAAAESQLDPSPESDEDRPPAKEMSPNASVIAEMHVRVTVSSVPVVRHKSTDRLLNWYVRLLPRRLQDEDFGDILERLNNANVRDPWPSAWLIFRALAWLTQNAARYFFELLRKSRRST